MVSSNSAINSGTASVTTPISVSVALATRLQKVFHSSDSSLSAILVSTRRQLFKAAERLELCGDVCSA